MSICRSCGAEIKWLITENGKKMPVDIDSIDDMEAEVFDQDQGMISHFATCSEAGKWRK